MCGKNGILALSEDKDIGNSQKGRDYGGEKKGISADKRIENAEKRCDDNEDQEKCVEVPNPFLRNQFFYYIHNFGTPLQIQTVPFWLEARYAITNTNGA